MAEKSAVQLLEEQNVLLREQNHLLGKMLDCQQKLLDRVMKGPPGGARTSSNGASVNAQPAARAGGQVASDRDLDGKYGDPLVRKLPKGWTTPDYSQGFHFSETSAEFLDILAEDLDGLADWIRTKKNEPEKAKYKELDAARARGWARRLRNGYRPAARPAEEDDGPSL